MFPLLSEIGQKSPLKSIFVLILLNYHKEHNIMIYFKKIVRGPLRVVVDWEFEVLVSITLGLPWPKVVY
jgi:hypothetical protein